MKYLVKRGANLWVVSHHHQTLVHLAALSTSLRLAAIRERVTMVETQSPDAVWTSDINPFISFENR